MTHGTIRSLRNDRGFGFITPDGGGEDIFFHSTAVAGGGYDQLREGERIEYEAGTDPRNPQRSRATNVRPVAQ